LPSLLLSAIICFPPQPKDASKSIEEVHQELVSIVTNTIDRVQTESSPLQRMWADGEYELPEPNNEKEEN